MAAYSLAIFLFLMLLAIIIKFFDLANEQNEIEFKDELKKMERI